MRFMKITATCTFNKNALTLQGLTLEFFRLIYRSKARFFSTNCLAAVIDSVALII